MGVFIIGSMDDPRKFRYDHQTIEAQWQGVWAQTSLDVADVESAKRPFYNLMMFPYPSAEGLHIGNMYAFIGSDIYGRFQRMRGYDVFEPIGLDGFGIHSENYALKIGRHPMDHARITQKHFYDQLHRIGAMFDFTRTLETYDSTYYRWTQWLFVQMFKAGLAYRAKAQVNFCPSCKTVLADEQVIESKCERCGNAVEKRSLEQWFFKITAYAEKLLGNIPKLKWSEKVKIAQTNWIGKKEGINIIYQVADEKGKPLGKEIVCFTTTPVNFATTFIVIAPEHPLITDMLRVIDKEQALKITNYVEQAKKKSQQDRIAEGRKKTGVFSGLYVINHVTGEKIPVWITDFVIMSVGTGAVQGCPGHDLRDFDFAMQFHIPIKRVVVGPDGDTSEITRREQVIEHGPGKMVNSGFLDGMGFADAMQKTMDYFVEKGWGKRAVTFHLRDWLISRQRYWGPPIPMIYCASCGKEGKTWDITEDAMAREARNSKHEARNKSKNQISNDQNYFGFRFSDFGFPASMAGWYPVPEDQLPVLLPRIEDYKPSADGIAPLSKHKEFFDTVCPYCGKPAVRETDVSDTFLDSSWYFLRYPSLHSHFSAVANEKFDPSSVASSNTPSARVAESSEAGQNFVRFPQNADVVPFIPEITKKWLPVNMYTGGAEHSVLHLLYSRYITMVLHDLGYVDFDEPFTNFFAHGLIIKEGAKMSKSKGNIVNPDDYIAKYGSDAVRLYLMFIGPFSMGGDFRDTGMEGMARWVGRVWRIIQNSLIPLPAPPPSLPRKSPESIIHLLEKTIAKLTDDMEKRRYNAAIASLMELTNAIMDAGGALGQEELQKYILLLAPFAPYLSEEAWNLLNGRTLYTDPSDSVHRQSWPSCDPTILEEEEISFIIQVNGKLRDMLSVHPSDAKNQTLVEERARKSEKIQKHLSGKTVINTIFIPGKLINFVL